MEKEPRGEMRYCSCGAFIGRNSSVPDVGKTVVVVDCGCKDCQQRVNLIEKSEHD